MRNIGKAGCLETVRRVTRQRNCRLSRLEFKAELQGEPTYLNLKGGGDKSMLVKRKVPENVYGIVLQRLSGMVKA